MPLLLLIGGSFDYSYAWLVVLAVFVVFGVLIPCGIRAYRRRKYGLNVWGNNNTVAAPYERDHEPTGAEVSRRALAQIGVHQPTHITTTIQPSNNHITNDEYQFPSTGYKLNQYANNETNTAISKPTGGTIVSYTNESIPPPPPPPQYTVMDIPNNMNYDDNGSSGNDHQQHVSYNMRHY